MARARMTIHGVKQMQQRLLKISKVAQRRGADALAGIGEEIKLESQARAPEKTGDLVDSHKVTIDDDPSVGSTDVIISVGPVYNRGSEYSLVMHEGMYEGDPNSEYNLGPISEAKNVGTPHIGVGVGIKFLERAHRHVMRHALKDLGNAIGRALD